MVLESHCRYRRSEVGLQCQMRNRKHASWRKHVRDSVLPDLGSAPWFSGCCCCCREGRFGKLPYQRQFSQFTRGWRCPVQSRVLAWGKEGSLLFLFSRSTARVGDIDPQGFLLLLMLSLSRLLRGSDGCRSPRSRGWGIGSRSSFCLFTY